MANPNDVDRFPCHRQPIDHGDPLGERVQDDHDAPHQKYEPGTLWRLPVHRPQLPRRDGRINPDLRFDTSVFT